MSHTKGKAAINPVRANTGGYLRSPIAISSAFALSAEKHVSQSDAVLRKMKPWQKSGRAASGGEGEESEERLLAQRAWTRAGVGAGRLTAKEKSSQQSNAETVYGKNSALEDGEEDEGSSARAPLFGVDHRDQTAMQAAVPRSIRRHQELQHKQRQQRVTEESLSTSGGGMKRSRDDAEEPSDRAEKKVKSAPPAPAPAMNRMQRFDSMREAALFGDKKKKKKK